MNLKTLVSPLQGSTLYTLDQNHAFDVVSFTPETVVLWLHTTARQRDVPWKELDGVWNELQLHGMITRKDIQARYSPRNPAYVAAILAVMPGVSHTLKPITLHLDPPSS